jgi:hypothetical protein
MSQQRAEDAQAVEPARPLRPDSWAEPAAFARGSPLTATVLALQRAAGNSAVAALAPGWNRQLARACCSACASGERCEDDDEQDAERIAVAQRAIARAVQARSLARSIKDDTAGLCGGTRTCASSAGCDTPDAVAAADPAGSWELTVAIDIEVEKAEDVTGKTVGHTYVEFKGADGKTWSYGFYPNPSTPVTEFKWEVFGCMVHPDTIHTKCVDHRETFKVGAAEYQAALDLAQRFCKAPPHYHLKDFNCTTFAKLIVETAGQKLAGTKGKVGGVLTTDNPNTLMQNIRERDIPTYKLTGDSEIRDWLKSHSYPEIGKLPEREKLRLITRLLEGYVHDDDLQAIEWVCKAVTDRSEMDRIDAAIRPRAKDLNERQGKRLNAILDIRPGA